MIHCHHGVCGPALPAPAHQMGSNMRLGSELHASGAPLGERRVGQIDVWSLDPHPDVHKPSSLLLNVKTTVPFSL